MQASKQTACKYKNKIMKNLKFKIESFQVSDLETTFKYCLQIKPRTIEEKLALLVFKRAASKTSHNFLYTESFVLNLSTETAMAFFILHKNKEFAPAIEHIFHKIHQILIA